jgi:hypothetical protein
MNTPIHPDAASWRPGRWGTREARRVRLAASVLLLGALLAAVFGTATPAATLAGDCTLSFEPPEVRAGEEAVEVHWTATEEIPEVDGVTVPRDSGLSVTLVDDRPGLLEVDAAEAMPGEWIIILVSDEQAVCEGPFYVI